MTSAAPPAPGDAQGALPAKAGCRLLVWRIDWGATIGVAGALLHASVERGAPRRLVLDNASSRTTHWRTTSGLCSQLVTSSGSPTGRGLEVFTAPLSHTSGGVGGPTREQLSDGARGTGG